MTFLRVKSERFSALIGNKEDGVLVCEFPKLPFKLQRARQHDVRENVRISWLRTREIV